jgi:hypothetical protein
MIPAEDQDWIEALAGRSDERATASAVEARALRDRILARATADADPVAAEDPARENELVERARREGLIPAPVARSREAAPAWWRGWRLAGAVAGLAAAVLVAGVLLQTPRREEATRGAREDVVSLQASDPEALQRQILSELRAAGIEARGYEIFGKRGIDADLPDPLPDEVRGILERHGIPPRSGVLQVEIGER